MSERDVMVNIIKAIGNHSAIHRAGYDEGVKAERRKALAKLDKAWAEINAQGGNDDNTAIMIGFLNATDKALKIIERLGGMDPAKRGKE